MQNWDWQSRLLYRDEDLIAVAKPSGIFTHRTALARDRLTVMSAVRDVVGERVFPLHRLDRPTSGVLLLVTRRELVRPFSELFAQRQIEKRYWAIVRGWPAAAGRVDRALKQEGGGSEQETATRYRSLAQARWPVPMGAFPEARFALVEAIPETGRWHQIRRHLQGIARPILNDHVHGDTRVNRYVREQLGVERLLLHATGLAFCDPRDGRERVFMAPLEPEMVALCERFNWPTTPDRPTLPGPGRPA